MLIDGAKFTPSSNPTETKIEQVSALPTTALSNGKEVVLTAQDGTNAPGPYTYLNGVWLSLLSQVRADQRYLPNDVAALAGTGLTVSGATLALDKSAIPYDIAGSVIGKATASALILTFKLPRACTLDANFSGSTAYAAEAATESSVFSINKNGSQIGTITYAAASDTATFSTQAAISLTAGDVLSIVAPATPDATLSGVAFTLAATLA